MLNSKLTLPLIICVLVFSNLAISVAHAQTAIAAAGGPNEEVLQSRIKEVEASTELDEASKSSLLELLRKSITFIEQRKNYDSAIKKFSGSRETAPEESSKLRKKLVSLESKTPTLKTASLKNDSLADIEQKLLSMKATQSELETQLAELENSIEAQAKRSVKARERLTQAKTRHAEITQAQQLPTPDDQPQRFIEARQWALDLEKKALSAEIDMLNQELLSQPMRVELLGVKRDKTTLELNRFIEKVHHFEEQVVERRREEAETATQDAEKTERQTIGKHPRVQQVAQQNTLLGEELKKMAAALQKISREENITSEQAKRIANNFRLARHKLDIAGLSEALGQALLEERRSLPEEKDFTAAAQQRQQLLIDSSLRQIRNQQERTRLRNINSYVNDLLDDLPLTEQDSIRDEIVKLVETRRDLIDKAIAADDTYLQSLEELDLAQRQLKETVTAYDAFLDERLLWIRSGEPPSWETIKSIIPSLSIFFSMEHWRQVMNALLSNEPLPWLPILGLIIFVLLRLAKPALLCSLQRSARNIGQLRHDHFSKTIKALIITLIVALPWSILLASLGLHLQYLHTTDLIELEAINSLNLESVDKFVLSIGAAFSEIALYALYFSALLLFCHPSGLAVNHFGWNVKLTRQLSNRTKHLIAFFFPTVFLLSASIRFDLTAMASGLSRLLFVIVMLAMAWYFVSIFAPHRGVLSGFYKTHPKSPLSWFRLVWLTLGLSLPLLLAAFAVVGYVYTAAQLGARLIDTVWLIVVIILIHQLVVRWVLLTERRLAFKAAIEKHRAAKAALETAEDQEHDAQIDGYSLSLDEPEIDYGALSEDTNKLIKTALTVFGAFGLWAIWADILPAFGVLDGVSLWSYRSIVDGAETLVPVTLNDIILGILIIIVGIAAARRLPALLEIALLTRLKITAGGRYAISTLTQYSIVAISIVLVFNILGGRWSEIQWLIAALGVGIGFGLQEIVANFICGIILLFERPIRIGDVVTVGDTDGVVTKIRIRSTTIRDRDEKELIVPNKEFITGRLLNWTLSDQISRIVIPVGIAYGSDIPLALKLVQDSATEHERVLDEPKPLVTLESFGDNSLVIILRCFIGAMEFRLHTTSELHQAIYRKFEEAGIVISFPQRDIHLDTTRPLDIRIHRSSESENGVVPQ